MTTRRSWSGRPDPARVLFQRGHARQRDLMVLCAGAAADTDRADQLAADDDRIAARRGDDAVEGQQGDTRSARGYAFLEAQGRTAKGCGSPGLVDRDVD